MQLTVLGCWAPYPRAGGACPGYLLQAGTTNLFMPTEHPLPCYAAAVEFQGKRIVYTADTGWTARLVPFLRGADLLLCEASLQEADAAYAAAGHLTAGQAGELAQQAGVRKLALTHFWPEYNLAVTKQEAQRAFDGVVDLAAEGKVWKVE